MATSKTARRAKAEPSLEPEQPRPSDRDLAIERLMQARKAYATSKTEAARLELRKMEAEVGKFDRPARSSMFIISDAERRRKAENTREFLAFLKEEGISIPDPEPWTRGALWWDNVPPVPPRPKGILRHANSLGRKIRDGWSGVDGDLLLAVIVKLAADVDANYDRPTGGVNAAEAAEALARLIPSPNGRPRKIPPRDEIRALAELIRQRRWTAIKGQFFLAVLREHSAPEAKLIRNALLGKGSSRHRTSPREFAAFDADARVARLERVGRLPYLCAMLWLEAVRKGEARAKTKRFAGQDADEARNPYSALVRMLKRHFPAGQIQTIARWIAETGMPLVSQHGSPKKLREALGLSKEGRRMMARTARIRT